MATVTDISTYRKPQSVTHYAYLRRPVWHRRTAQRLRLSLPPRGERKATLVSYKDPELVLLGRATWPTPSGPLTTRRVGWRPWCVATGRGANHGALTLSPDRAAWREAVAAIAEKAKAKLPECNGRVDKAVALVLAAMSSCCRMAPPRWPARATAPRRTMVSTASATATTSRRRQGSSANMCDSFILNYCLAARGRMGREEPLTNSITMWVKDPLRGVR